MSGYLTGTAYMTRSCKYPFCNSAPRFLLRVTDPTTKKEHEYIVCGKHTAPGITDVHDTHEAAPSVWAIPRMPRRR